MNNEGYLNRIDQLPGGRLITTNHADQPEYKPMQFTVEEAFIHLNKCVKLAPPYYTEPEQYSWGLMGWGFF